jgi:hypothetical protein
MDPFRLVELKSINEFRDQNKDKSQTYEGDLEADHLGSQQKSRKQLSINRKAPRCLQGAFFLLTVIQFYNRCFLTLVFNYRVKC